MIDHWPLDQKWYINYGTVPSQFWEVSNFEHLSVMLENHGEHIVDRITVIEIDELFSGASP